MSTGVTSWHFCIKLDKLLELALKGSPIFLDHEDGTSLTEKELYQFVKEQKELGRVYFSGCDNINPDGSCAGHKGG